MQQLHDDIDQLSQDKKKAIAKYQKVTFVGLQLVVSMDVNKVSSTLFTGTCGAC